MLKSKKFATCLMAIGILVAGVSGCQKKEASTSEKGPAEKAGQQIDQATARAGEELNKAAEKAGQTMQELGKKLQDEAQNKQKSGDASNTSDTGKKE